MPQHLFYSVLLFPCEVGATTLILFRPLVPLRGGRHNSYSIPFSCSLARWAPKLLFYSVLLFPCKVGATTLSLFIPLVPLRGGRHNSCSIPSSFYLARWAPKHLACFVLLFPCAPQLLLYSVLFFPCKVGATIRILFRPLVPFRGGRHNSCSFPSSCYLAVWAPQHPSSSGPHRRDSQHCRDGWQ